MRRNKKILFICQGAVIAAAYTVLTLISHLFGLDAGAFQLRISEALCVLPAFTAAAIPGLYVGCLLSAVLTGAVWLDVLVGPIATLLGALGAYFICRTGNMRCKYFVPLPTLVANTLIIPPVLAFGYSLEAALPYLWICVGVSELLSAYVLGLLFYTTLDKRRNQIFF